jgi:hypothetical protein
MGRIGDLTGSSEPGRGEELREFFDWFPGPEKGDIGKGILKRFYGVNIIDS